MLAALLDDLGHHESAATISGFAAGSLALSAFPEIGTAIAHLRAELGDQRYESLASRGTQMTRAEMADYAFDQIDHASAQLAVSG